MSQLNDKTRAKVFHMPDMIGGLDWVVGSATAHRLAAYATELEAKIFADGYNRRLEELAEHDPGATREAAVAALCTLITGLYDELPSAQRARGTRIGDLILQAEKEALRW